MEWDDEGLGDEPASPLLPPDDRLWRHPSEVAGAPATIPTSVRGPSGGTGAPRVLTAVALTSCLSVLLTVGMVAVVRPFRDNAPPVEPAAAPDEPDVAVLTAQLRPAIARVVAVAAGGERSWGSGVVIRGDGLVLTAHHVVAGAASVRVLLDDGRNLVARLIGGDVDTDIALLDLEGDGYAAAPLATSRSSMRVGEPAFTIGARSGNAGPLVRASMVSGTSQEAGAGGRKFVDVIRTDAAVEDGCAGGAVVDGEGRVIGIAVSNMTTADGATGVATPIDVARSVADQLLATGKVERAWLGIDGESHEDGAVVRAVKPGSPAEVAGLTAGDVIEAIDDDEVASMADVVIRLRERRPGHALELRVRRGGDVLAVPVTLGEKPAA